MFGKILIRLGAGGSAISMGSYLIVETVIELGSPFYFVTSVFGLFAVVAGCFLVVWDGWL